MATLSNGTATIIPDIIDGYESESTHGNIVHPILGSEDVDVVLRPAKLRTGTMSLVIGDETAAAAAETALRTATTWTITTGDRSSIDMAFVVTDTVRRQLEDSTRDAWIVSFGWQEIAP